ncbi:MAG: diacylglycerol kinase family protein [Myxococcales bacterium]
MQDLSIIANPSAHRNRVWALASQSLRKAAPGVAILETRTPGELSAAVARIARERPRVVAIAGGDGTVQHTLTALDRALGPELPPLALLGGGAYDSLSPLSGRGGPDGKLRRLSEALASGAELQIAERDTLRVEGQCGFRLGVGLPVRFVEAVYATGRAGPSMAAWLFARAAASLLVGGKLSRALFEKLELAVSADGEEWPPLPLFGVLCTTVAEAGLRLHPFRRATEQPGSFEILGLTAGPRAFALEIPRLLAGRPARRDRLLNTVAERAQLSSPRGFAWFLDGELRLCAGQLAIGLGPRVRLVRA